MTDILDTETSSPVQQSMEEWLFREEGPLSADQARAVTAKIKGYAGALQRLAVRAHERRIWLALGYSSWAEYCAEELDMSRSRGYQLVDYGLVQRALGTGEAEDAPAPADDVDRLTEAQARPLAPFKSDPRAARLIWDRACEIAGPNDTPSQAQVQQAVDEWKVPADGELWRSEARLVTGATWTAGPVWWTWQTPSDGVKLYLGLGEVPGALTMHERALFKSEARYGDLAAVAADDLDNLVPRLIAELFARQVPAAEEVYEVARLVADMNIEWGKRGPFRLDHEQVAGAFAELAHIYDDDGSWSDTSSHAPVDDEPPAAAVVDPDDEVVDAEIIDDDDPPPAPPAGPSDRDRVLAELRQVEAELADTDCPPVRRLLLTQKRMDLEARLDGRVPPTAAPAAHRPAAASSPAVPPLPADTEEEVGDDGPGLPSSSTPPAATRERALIEDEDELHRWCREYVIHGLIDTEPMLVRHAAGFFRCLASRFEDRAAALERELSAVTR